MTIYDISQEVFSCQVYAGDPGPERKLLRSTERGDLYNLTAFSIDLIRELLDWYGKLEWSARPYAYQSRL